jgi:hypothetical protein
MLWIRASQRLFARLCVHVVREVSAYLQQPCLPELSPSKLRLYNPMRRTWKSVLLSEPLDLECAYLLVSTSDLLVVGLGTQGNCAIVDFNGQVKHISALPVAVSGPGLCCRARTKEIYALGGLCRSKPARNTSMLTFQSQAWRTLNPLCLPRGYPCAAEQSSGLFICDAVCATPEHYSYSSAAFTPLPLLEPLPACLVTVVQETCVCVTTLGDLISVDGRTKRVKALANWEFGMKCYRVGTSLYFLKYPLTLEYSLSVVPRL